MVKGAAVIYETVLWCVRLPSRVSILGVGFHLQNKKFVGTLSVSIA